MTQKTVKAIAKRFKVKKSGKIMKQTAGKNHYNSRESGKTRRNKRMDKKAAKPIQRVIKSNISK